MNWLIQLHSRKLSGHVESNTRLDKRLAGYVSYGFGMDLEGILFYLATKKASCL